MNPKQLNQLNTLFQAGAGLRTIVKLGKFKNAYGFPMGHSGINYYKKKLEKTKGQKYPNRFISVEELKKLL